MRLPRKGRLTHGLRTIALDDGIEDSDVGVASEIKAVLINTFCSSLKR